MINRANMPGVRSSAVGGALYQGLPATISQVISPNGVMSEAWYRFFQMVWLKNSSGISNDVTLATVADAAETAQLTADAAQATATNAANAVEAETERATGVEANLQGQITNNNNTLSGRFGAINTFGATVGASPGGLVGYINVTANGVAYAIQLFSP